MFQDKQKSATAHCLRTPARLETTAVQARTVPRHCNARQQAWFLHDRITGTSEWEPLEQVKDEPALKNPSVGQVPPPAAVQHRPVAPAQRSAERPRYWDHRHERFYTVEPMQATLFF